MNHNTVYPHCVKFPSQGFKFFQQIWRHNLIRYPLFLSIITLSAMTPCQCSLVSISFSKQSYPNVYTWRIFLWFLTVIFIVKPAVQRFSREGEAFGSSFWRESVYVSSILTFWLFCRTSDSFYRLWGIVQPMDAPTEVTRCDGRTHRGISIAQSIAFVIWRRQAPLKIWTCSSSEKYAFRGMFSRTICLSSLLSQLIMTQTSHFHALSPGNRWTAGSTVITAVVLKIFIAQ